MGPGPPDQWHRVRDAIIEAGRQPGFGYISSLGESEPQMSATRPSRTFHFLLKQKAHAVVITEQVALCFRLKWTCSNVREVS
jgi:hypothetical protein